MTCNSESRQSWHVMGDWLPTLCPSVHSDTSSNFACLSFTIFVVFLNLTACRPLSLMSRWKAMVLPSLLLLFHQLSGKYWILVASLAARASLPMIQRFEKTTSPRLCINRRRKFLQNCDKIPAELCSSTCDPLFINQ